MGFGIEDLKGAGIVANTAPATQTTAPAASTASTTAREDSEKDSADGYDTSGLEDDTGSQDLTQAQIEARENQTAYDEASQDLQAALSRFGVQNSTSSDYDSVQAQIEELRQLGTAAGVTTDGTAEAGDSTLQETDATLAMKKEEYESFVDQLEALQNGSLTQDMSSFGELAQQFNTLSTTLDSSTEGYNADLLENTGDLIFFTEEDYAKIQNAMGAAMTQTLGNSVSELYESNDYRILTGEIEATDEEKQQARANFESRKASITEAGRTFNDLGLDLPDNCQVVTVVEWNSEPKEGDVSANDCMDRIIYNYLRNNDLYGKISAHELHEMVMQLNPDIYSEIDSTEYIHAGQQFLMPDPSAIKNQESVKQQIVEEALLADPDSELATVLSEYGDNVDYNFNGKTNTINVVNKQTGEVYTAKIEYVEGEDGEGGYRVVSEAKEDGESKDASGENEDAEETKVTRESIDASMEHALSMVGIEEASQVDGRFSTGDVSGNGNFENVYTYTDENGEEGKVRIQYDPVTGKTTMNYITEEKAVQNDDGSTSYEYETSGDVVYDENENSLSYVANNGDDTYSQYVDYLDENGEVIAKDAYNPDGTLASTTIGSGDDAQTATYTYSSSGRIESVTIGDQSYSVQSLQGEYEGLSTYDAVDALKQIARGATPESAVENIQNGQYSYSDAGEQTVTLDEEEFEQFSSIASELRADFPSDGVEFKKNADGTYTGEYKVVEHMGGDTIESTCKVSYNPETGKTTMKYYPGEIEDGKESSIIEYDPTTRTKTSNFSDGSEYVQVYSDDIPSQDNLLRTNSKTEDSASVVTYNNGKATGTYRMQLGDDGQITEFTVTDMNGVKSTLSESELNDIAENAGVSQTDIQKIIEDIQGGKSANDAFSSTAGKAIIEAMSTKEEDTIVVSSKAALSESETNLNDFESAIEDFVPELEGFETDGTINESGELTYTKKAEEEGGKDEVYTAVKNDDGTITFTSEDETKTITVDNEHATKETVTKEEDKTTTEFTKYTNTPADENGNIKINSDTIKYETDENGEIQTLIVNGTTIAPADLPEGFDVESLKDELTTLNNGENSPNTILTNALGNLVSGSTSIETASDKEKEEITFDTEDFMEASQHDWAYEYLKENVTYENIGAVLTALQAENGDSWTLSSYLYAGSSVNSANAMDYITDTISIALSDGYVDELKENGQYEAVIQTLANDAYNMNSLFDNAILSETGLSGEVIADVIYLTEGEEVYASPLVSMDRASEVKEAMSDALIELAAKDSQGIIEGSNTTYSDYALDILKNYAQIEINYYNSAERLYGFIDEMIAADDTGALMVNFGGLMTADGYSLFDAFQNDEEYCKKLADTYANAYNAGLGSEWQSYIKEQLSNELYLAMRGSGCRTAIINAIYQDYQNKGELLKAVERDFNEVAKSDAHGGYHSTLYKYMIDQGGETEELARELKKAGFFDNLNDEVDTN